jgi:hypothetical protein
VPPSYVVAVFSVHSQSSPPSFPISASPLSALTQIDIIRNNQYIYTRTDDPREREFRFYDKDAAPGQTYYYYVRVQQADEQIAWSSPIWVTCRG